MSKKHFGASRAGASVSNRLAGRYSAAEPAEQQHQQAPPAPAKPPMVTRSWYLPRDTADALATTADRLWRETPGTSKHQVLAALIEIAVERSDEARDRLCET